MRISGTINSAFSTPSYLLALLRELSHVPQALLEIAEANLANIFDPPVFDWFLIQDRSSEYSTTL